MASQSILDGCFNNLIYPVAALYYGDFSKNLYAYKGFLENAEITPEMKENLAGNYRLLEHASHGFDFMGPVCAAPKWSSRNWNSFIRTCVVPKSSLSILQSAE